ncbi:unnamed protein product [Toxocara canis]|uniref:Aromatic-L-amino-acid decarboxylase n=1 Tax=Toxocara canis TaxID=6265 RepID=A0A183UNE6_TOXCA|nr:unnamed protein product [Toxocara canis]
MDKLSFAATLPNKMQSKRYGKKPYLNVKMTNVLYFAKFLEMLTQISKHTAKSTFDTVARFRKSQLHSPPILDFKPVYLEMWKKKLVPAWAALAIMCLVCFGYVCMAVIFFVDHAKNRKRITLAKSKSVALKKSEGDRAEKKKEKKSDKKQSSGVAVADEFVKKMTDIATFCVKVDERANKKADDAKGKGMDRSTPPNEKPISLENVLAELQADVLPMFDERPPVRAHGFYPGVQSKTDIIVSALCDTLASQGNITDGCRAMDELEMISTNWIGKAIGLPNKFLFEKDSCGGGLIQSTITQGMFTALMASSQRKLREMQPANAEAKKAEAQGGAVKKMVAYGCQESHFSFDIGCRLAKLECKLIATDIVGAIDIEELKREIVNDVKSGKAPTFINVTFGSAQTCAFDKLAEVVKVAKQYGMWVHIEASYAGNYFVCERYRDRLVGIEDAQSICINLHKCLTQCCTETLFWTVDYKIVKRSLPMVNNMLAALHADGSCHELATASTNRYKALKTYVWLKLSGVEGLKEYLRSITSMTLRFRQYMNVDGRLTDKTSAPDYGFVAFSCKNEQIRKLQGPQSNDLTYRFCSYIIRSGKMYVSMVSSNRSIMIRMAFNREHFAQSEIDESWNVLRQLLDDWQSEEKKGNLQSKEECARYIHEGNGNFMGPPSLSFESLYADINANAPLAIIGVASKEKAKEKGPIMSSAESSKKNEGGESDKRQLKPIIGKLPVVGKPEEKLATAEPDSTVTAKYPDHVLQRKPAKDNEKPASSKKAAKTAKEDEKSGTGSGETSSSNQADSEETSKKEAGEDESSETESQSTSESSSSTSSSTTSLTSKTQKEKLQKQRQQMQQAMRAQLPTTSGQQRMAAPAQPKRQRGAVCYFM